MPARTRYLVCYDICHPKRLRQVAKICESFGQRLQYSVFECPLDDLRFEKLRAALLEIIKYDDDQILFVSLGPEGSKQIFRIETLGRPYSERSRVTII
jgi:CRISPR-associated protein Cas2